MSLQQLRFVAILLLDKQRSLADGASAELRRLCGCVAWCAWMLAEASGLVAGCPSPPRFCSGRRWLRRSSPSASNLNASGSVRRQLHAHRPCGRGRAAGNAGAGRRRHHCGAATVSAGIFVCSQPPHRTGAAASRRTARGADSAVEARRLVSDAGPAACLACEVGGCGGAPTWLRGGVCSGSIIKAMLFCLPTSLSDRSQCWCKHCLQ